MRDDKNKKQCKTIQHGFASMLRSAEWEGRISTAMMDNVEEYSRTAFYNGAAYAITQILDTKTAKEMMEQIDTLAFEILVSQKS